MEMDGEPNCKRARLNILEHDGEEEEQDVNVGKRSEVKLNIPTVLFPAKSSLAGDLGRMGIGQGVESSLNKVQKIGEMGAFSVGQEATPFMSESLGDVASTPCPDIHPLLIPHVLDIVFTHIVKHLRYWSQWPAKDVQNIRLVCHLWKDRVTPLYRRVRTRLEFGDWGRYRNDEPIDDDEETLAHMTRFMDAMRSSDMVPIHRYRFDGNFFPAIGSKQIMKEFLRICGPEAMSFHFFINDFATEYLDLKDLQLDQLKQLKVRLRNVGREREPSGTYELAYFMASLLDGAHSLRKFLFEADFYNFEPYTYQSDHHSQILEQFERVIFRRIPKSVKNLCLSMFLTKSTFRTLTENGLKLEELTIPSNCVSNSDKEILKKFLQNQNDTLRVLRIHPPYLGDDEAPGLELPRLKGLHSLELFGAHVRPFSIVDYFPNLYCLNLHCWGDEERIFFNYAMKTAPSVRRIHLPYSIPNLPLLPQVLRCFSNLTELHLSSGDLVGTLQGVFADMPGLEVLDIEVNTSPQFNADTALSGISEADWERIRKLPTFDEVNVEELERKPSILNLTKLRKLLMKCENPVTLTDFSAHFVFLRMGHLKNLRLPDTEMSPSYIDRLRQKLFLTLDYENWVDEEEREEIDGGDDDDAINEGRGRRAQCSMSRIFNF